MPKRKRDCDKEDKWRKKILKYERKLSKKRAVAWSSDEDEWDEPSRSGSPGQRDELLAGATPPPPTIPVSPSPTLQSPQPQCGSVERASTMQPQAPTRAATSPPSMVPPPPPPAITPPIDVTTSHTAPQTLAVNISDPQTDDQSDRPPAADPELLAAIGAYKSTAVEWGPNIVEELSKQWEPILKEGLKEEVREELKKKYAIPKNCPLLKAPVLNAEIASNLKESSLNRDLRLFKKQNQIGLALAIVGNTMSGILTKSIDTHDMLRNLSDASKLLADSHFSETETRRYLVSPTVDKMFIDPLKDRKRDSHLFGENLGDFIKSSRNIQKAGKLIQTQQNLNWKGPPSRQSRAYVTRGGASRAPPVAAAGSSSGPRRASYAYRRRAPMLPPRRPPPSPPPAPATMTSRNRLPAANSKRS